MVGWVLNLYSCFLFCTTVPRIKFNKLLLTKKKDASIVHLYKYKGNRQMCDNHRGISLLCILLNRLTVHLEQGLLPESQCGFRKEQVDMIFTAQQLQEKCQEQNVDLYTTFVGLTKAFDTIIREGLCKIMSKFGCPERFICIVRQFHEGMQACVLHDGDLSAPFPVTNRVKQGCVLAPKLFSMMFSAMLLDTFLDTDPGMDIIKFVLATVYRPPGHHTDFIK